MAATAAHQTHYRHDIDGLRAIAVLGVVVYHIWPNALTGGFLGVDMFFVISGFLITGNITRQRDNGSFSFSEFYKRRIKRLFPAVGFLIACCFVPVLLIYLTDDIREFSASALFSSLQAANIFFAFFVDASYFADSSYEKPLLHLWSLGVEEQFYLIWPACLIALLKLRNKAARLTAVILATITSFIHGEMVLKDHPDYAYYMITTRGCELLAGAALALAYADGFIKPGASHALRTLFGGAGVALILYCFIAMRESDGFPGFSAAPITLATLLLLAAGRDGAHLFSRALTNPLSIWFGLISYSLYLWHWPLLSFAHYSFIEITFPTGLVLFAFMLAGASISYYLVEKPVRYGADGLYPALGKYVVLPAAATAILLVCFQNGPPPWRKGQEFARHAEDYTAVKAAYEYPSVLQRPLLTAEDIENPDYLFNADGNAQVLLYGDSQAAQYVGFFETLAKEAGFSLRNASHSACPPVIGDTAAYVASRYRDSCQQSRATMLPYLEGYDAVIISAQWNLYARHHRSVIKHLETMIDRLSKRNGRVILMAPLQPMQGLDRSCAERAVLNPFIHCADRFRFPRPDNRQATNAIIALANARENVDYFDINDLICKDDVCSAYFGNRLVYYNETHISYTGGIALAAGYLTEGGVPAPFDQLVSDSAKRQKEP